MTATFQKISWSRSGRGGGDIDCAGRGRDGFFGSHPWPEIRVAGDGVDQNAVLPTTSTCGLQPML